MHENVNQWTKYLSKKCTPACTINTISLCQHCLCGDIQSLFFFQKKELFCACKYPGEYMLKSVSVMMMGTRVLCPLPCPFTWQLLSNVTVKSTTFYLLHGKTHKIGFVVLHKDYVINQLQTPTKDDFSSHVCLIPTHREQTLKWRISLNSISSFVFNHFKTGYV